MTDDVSPTPTTTTAIEKTSKPGPRWIVTIVADDGRVAYEHCWTRSKADDLSAAIDDGEVSADEIAW